MRRITSCDIYAAFVMHGVDGVVALAGGRRDSSFKRMFGRVLYRLAANGHDSSTLALWARDHLYTRAPRGIKAHAKKEPPPPPKPLADQIDMFDEVTQ
jgi:hypothetical protein